MNSHWSKIGHNCQNLLHQKIFNFWSHNSVLLLMNLCIFHWLCKPFNWNSVIIYSPSYHFKRIGLWSSSKLKWRYIFFNVIFLCSLINSNMCIKAQIVFVHHKQCFYELFEVVKVLVACTISGGTEISQVSLKISSFVFWRWMKVLWDWNNRRLMSKWWQNFHFWENKPFNSFATFCELA